MRFSQRIGKAKVREQIQLEGIDEVLTNRLWNILDDFFKDLSGHTDRNGNTDKGVFFYRLWTEFFNERGDRVRAYRRTHLLGSSENKFSSGSVYKYVSDWFFDSEWYEKYDLIEFIAGIKSVKADFHFSAKINEALEREMSAFRIVDYKIVPITSELELSEIEEALALSGDSVNVHLTTALAYLSDRKNPDYRNSIKESISAVESCCQKITGDKKATLGKALAKVERTHPLHASLKASFSSLYGYTSDASGIRHALADGGRDPSFEEAKFMLVSCSAFINYLKSLAK